MPRVNDLLSDKLSAAYLEKIPRDFITEDPYQCADENRVLGAFGKKDKDGNPVDDCYFSKQTSRSMVEISNYLYKQFEAMAAYAQKNNFPYCCVTERSSDDEGEDYPWRALVMANKDTLVIGFRGTKYPANWVRNLECNRTNFTIKDNADGSSSESAQAHIGFVKAMSFLWDYQIKVGSKYGSCFGESDITGRYNQLEVDGSLGEDNPSYTWEEPGKLDSNKDDIWGVKAIVRKCLIRFPDIKNVYVTGHSLGAAMAVLLRPMLDKLYKEMFSQDREKLEQLNEGTFVYSCATPGTGNKEFQKQFNQEYGSRTMNVINPKDPIRFTVFAGLKKPGTTFLHKRGGNLKYHNESVIKFAAKLLPSPFNPLMYLCFCNSFCKQVNENADLEEHSISLYLSHADASLNAGGKAIVNERELEQLRKFNEELSSRLRRLEEAVGIREGEDIELEYSKWREAIGSVGGRVSTAGVAAASASPGLREYRSTISLLAPGEEHRDAAEAMTRVRKGSDNEENSRVSCV